VSAAVREGRGDRGEQEHCRRRGSVAARPLTG
jgi:hypothetical protein